MNIFVNSQEERPRTGWRLLLQFLLFLFFTSAMSYAYRLMIEEPLQLYQTLAMGIGAVASVWMAAIFLDRRAFNEYGTKFTPLWKKECLLGIGIGLAAIGFVFGSSWLFGWIEITGFGWERSAPTPYILWLANYLIAMLIVGYYEELVFRGYQILNLTEGFLQPGRSPVYAVSIAILISSVIFGVMHGSNPSASWISTLNIILAGIILAIPFILTGRLALSVGLHAGWNLFLGGIFGFPVSGVPFRGSLIQIERSGPEFLLGSTFGPEAGLLGIAGMFIMLGGSLFYLRRINALFGLHPSFYQPGTNFDKTDEQA